MPVLCKYKKEIEIQRLKVWGFPCQDLLFDCSIEGFLFLRGFRAYTDLSLAKSIGCRCGKNCKPIKLYITVSYIKTEIK